jgi:hypothetical protein
MKRIPFADYDHKESSIGSYKISGSEFIENVEDSDVTVLLKRTSKIRLAGLHCLPNAVRAPLVDKTIASILKQYARGDMQLVPVTVVLRDGDCFDYSYARPLIEAPCLDLDKSEIEDWIVPGKRILDARRLVFAEDCLGTKDFIRETYTGHVVVSEKLKNALTATGDRGLNFKRPEEMWSFSHRHHRVRSSGADGHQLRDLAGRITGIDELAVSKDWSYTYNHLYWLITADNLGDNTLDETFAYSPSSNLLSRKRLAQAFTKPIVRRCQVDGERKSLVGGRSGLSRVDRIRG